MRLRRKIFIIVGIFLLLFGFYVYDVVSPDSSAGYRTRLTPIFSSDFPIESFENEIVVVDLKNDSNYQYELVTLVNDPVNVSWIILDPDGYEVDVFYSHEGFNPFTNDEGLERYRIIGRFNSTVSGNYSILMTEISGQSFLAEFEVAELTHTWFDRYKHDFNPASIFAFPLILSGICLLILAVVEEEIPK